MTKSITPKLLQILKAIRLIKSTTYEISSRCNLTCEGCLFFSGEHAYQHNEKEDYESWRSFFKKEAERGITFAFLAGAEPALVLDRIRAAWEFIPSGMIVTNGTKRIPDDIGFRIHISLWGGEDTSALTRGADVTQKAFRNYAHDPRAMFVYTINPLNLDEIIPMAHKCSEHGVPMTFNYYSPTVVYQNSLVGTIDEKGSDYFRFSNDESNLVMSRSDYQQARQIIQQAKAKYPDTIIYSMAYDDWVTSEQVYELDNEGIATNCACRTNNVHHTYFVDQTKSNLKCANPTFDCRECRTYINGMSSHMRIENKRELHSGSKAQWSDALECWDRIFMGNQWSRLKEKTLSKPALTK